MICNAISFSHIIIFLNIYIESSTIVYLTTATIASSTSPRNCLHLGPTQIREKWRDTGNDTFNHDSTELKDTLEKEFLFKGIKDYLEKAY